MKIAIVGSGIAGLYAAHYLSKHHQVTVYEANSTPGGHTDTHNIVLGDRTYAVDTGFIVFNEHNYKGLDLSEAVKNRIKEKTGDSFEGRICLLTHLRFMGFCFNPVSFYFCYPEGTESPRYILAEINNTPWNERYCYVLDGGDSPAPKNKWTFEFDKAFHVSPFMPMQQHYRWQLSLHEAILIIHMQLQQDNESCFDATLQLKAQAMSTRLSFFAKVDLTALKSVITRMVLWLKTLATQSGACNSSEPSSLNLLLRILTRIIPAPSLPEMPGTMFG